MMTRAQLRQHALSTVRKFGEDAVLMGRVPQIKEQELLLFMYALIDAATGQPVPDPEDRERIAQVRRLGGFVPKL